jgi:para-nitrobenzyl esterase
MDQNHGVIGRRVALQAAIGIVSLRSVASGATEQSKAVRDSSKPQNPVVETASGKVRGFTNAGVAVFRGIPYGATTTGTNRFMAPRPPEPWPGVRNCLSYGHSCPEAGLGIRENDAQARNTDEDEFLLYGTRGWIRGEDCLRLNVWTPAAASSGRKRPVMVFMHGGGFTGGSGNDLLCYDGENLARHHDIVVVTHNHRLNLFGYLNLVAVGGDRYADSGNVGMLDIVAVLQWVRDNISNFGGDATNVLIFGQSGGGGKVTMLMAMPAAKGLFHRAVVESGSMLRAGSLDNAARVAAAVLEELGISRSNIEKLHSLLSRSFIRFRPACCSRCKLPSQSGW